MAKKKNKGEVKKKSIADLKADYSRPETRYIDTGIMPLNELWGGGMPTGKVIEIYALEGVGKTTVVLQILEHMITNYGIKAAFKDIEHSLDENLKHRVGVDKYEDDGEVPSFLHLNPASFEEIEEVMESVIDDYDVIVFDSLVATTTSGGITDLQIGEKARFQGNYLEKYRPLLARKGKTLIIINQMRENISSFYAYTDRAGGRALKYYTDIVTGLKKVSKGEILNENNQRIGMTLQVGVVKNKVGMPFRYFNADLHFGKGIDKISAVTDILIKKGICEKRGGYYTLPNSDQKVQGKEGLKDWIHKNFDQINDIVESINLTGEIEEKDE